MVTQEASKKSILDIMPYRTLNLHSPSGANAVRNVRHNFSLCAAIKLHRKLHGYSHVALRNNYLSIYLMVWRASPIFDPIFKQAGLWHLSEAP